MKQLNPIIEALDGIDEDIALAAAKRRKKNKPLKIVIISVAAALLLGTTAAAATLGKNPLVKLNNRTYPSKFWSYTDENGWTLKTTVVDLPEDYTKYSYKPVGEIRPVFTANATGRDEFKYYDELGVLLDEVTDLYIFCNAEKPDEDLIKYIRFSQIPDRHVRITGGTDGTEYINIWQDPIQAGQAAYGEWVYDRMSLDEKVELWLNSGWDFGIPNAGGYKHPSIQEIVGNASDFYSTWALIAKFDGSPSAAAERFYDYSLDIPEGFAEKDDIQTITYHEFDLSMITQQMFIYTVTDDTSGKDVKFTVWRSAEAKDTYTDHFGFEYEYITLNNGTQARLHQSGYTYIVEFEKDGAAYAFQTDIDRGLVERVLDKMGMMY